MGQSFNCKPIFLGRRWRWQADLKLGIRPRPNPRNLYSWLFLGEVFGKHRERTDITLLRWGINSSRDLESFSAAKISDIDQHRQNGESQRPSTTCRRCCSASDFSLGRPLGLRHFLCYYSQPLLLVTASKDEVNNHDSQWTLFSNLALSSEPMASVEQDANSR